ncbi:MAG TPA: EFR1 family ferrodoxin [Spirochaetales bacterium]|nr:EFR1 family ferrodoxin [Spirochaetales bacterium]HRY54051.1 EFR1 family ferrodoxin [Spirochaetia bacterium]HRZ63431.1 EFR1 family ferrodoxin [Spirochaetia bacterium]
MKTVIYYYTATGNSLALARELARGLGDASVVPMGKARGAAVKPAAERVGLVFPIYAWGAPRTVEEFAASLDPSGISYAFAIASCGGTAAGTLPRLRRILRSKGGELHAGFVVRSPGYLVSDPESKAAKLIELVRRHSGPLPGTEAERLPGILAAVAACRSSKPERGAFLGTALGDFFHGMAAKQFPAMDSGYEVSSACTGCGTCVRVCPRANVALAEGRPAWRHDCDNCGACATWCPSRAISQAGGLAPTGKHRAEVRLEDMLLR